MNNTEFLKYKYKTKESVNDIEKKCIENIGSININESVNDLKDELIQDDIYNDDDYDDNIKNISDIDELAKIIKMILELSWGKDWGEIIPEYIEDDTNPTFPKIVYDINTRELSEHSAKKPILYNHIKEVVDGKETGDGFNIYRQWYDTVVEFNFYHHTIKEARKLMHEFENVISTYIGTIKKQGLSEMLYLEEIPSEKSMKYKPGIPMKSNAYYVRFENIHKVRTSLLKEIEYIVSVGSK